MIPTYTVQWVIKDLLSRHTDIQPLSRSDPPPYIGTSSNGIMLAVESMKDHTTNEGNEIQLALQTGGYRLVGHKIPAQHPRNSSVLYEQGMTNVWEILNIYSPGVVVVQDKREWLPPPNNFRDAGAKFIGIEALRAQHSVFKATILKDAHQQPWWHKGSADEIGCHAWIIYYHPEIVTHLAPFVRAEHLIRTYHSIDPRCVPGYDPRPNIQDNSRCNALFSQRMNNGRDGALLSGALSGAYPLRQRLAQSISQLPRVTHLIHPGYHRKGTCTPNYLSLLSRFKVSICTASRYGYALRKIIEATACGCMVITDLPCDEVLPNIDGNLIRVHPDSTPAQVAEILSQCYASYNVDRQKHFAEEAVRTYDYRAVGLRLASDIEIMRSKYIKSQV
jgi:hypothetical protein